MHRFGQVAVVAAVAFLAGLLPTQAQQLDLGHQMVPGYIVAPSPIFPNAQPYYAPPPPPPVYQPSVPQYLPTYGGGMPGSTFNPRY
jgi:hypothetical protein